MSSFAGHCVRNILRNCDAGCGVTLAGNCMRIIVGMAGRCLGTVLLMMVCAAAKAQVAQQPDTAGMAACLAEIDSLMQIEARRQLEREAAAARAAGQDMVRSMRYVRLGDIFELGPVTRLVLRNSVDGFRTRVGGRTTAALHPQVFWQGYVSRGFKSRQNYFSSRITYMFDKKKRSADEYPRRGVSWLAMRELGMPYEIFRESSDDGLLSSLRWTQVDRFVRYNRQQLRLDYEWDRTVTTGVQVSAQSIATVGEWERSGLRTADVMLQTGLRPVENVLVTLSHRTGIKGLLRGQYNYNLTEIACSGQFAAGRGRLDVGAQAGIQWNAVPFLLLCMPQANMSYVLEPGAFSLINNDEFVNDRYACIMLRWDTGGLVMPHIPLLARLGCREYVGVRSLWGTVSDKNNFGVSLMDSAKPYCECSVGICNILGMLRIEYVRRLNYLDLPTAHRHGVRIGFDI